MCVVFMVVMSCKIAHSFVIRPAFALQLGNLVSAPSKLEMIFVKSVVIYELCVDSRLYFKEYPSGVDNLKKDLFVKGTRGRGVVGTHLVGMIESAVNVLTELRRETTSPPESKIFNVLMNTFVALDIGTVIITGIHSTMFSTAMKEDLEDNGCSERLTKAFSELRAKRLCGRVVSQSNRPLKFAMWDIWSAVKHRGVGDVDVIRVADGSYEVIVGEVAFPLQSFQEFVMDARDFIRTAEI